MIRALVALAVAALLVGCRPGTTVASGQAAPDAAPSPVSPAPEPPPAPEPRPTLGPHPELDRLCRHYACTVAPDGIRLSDGTPIPWDDGTTKSTAERIEHPDLEDVFALGYPSPSSPIEPVTDPERDPGRVRIEPLFRATYGADARAVSGALVPVKIAGRTVSFHRRAAPALERVAARIEALLAARPALARFFASPGGTYVSRTIAGTDRTSAHAWGIAIDIDPAQADYWRNGPTTWRNRVPQEIVDAFEAEGFVWGGRWFHYDTMHFEYRPELFAPGSPNSR